MSDAHHHLHIRKRLYNKHEVFPSPNRFKNIMDHLIYVAGIAIPLMTLPQLVEIYLHHNTEAVSALTWSAYFVGSCFWFTYGYLHEEKPIYIPNFLAAIIQALIVIGIFVYR